MALGALKCVLVAQIYGVSELAIGCRRCHTSVSLIDRRVTNVAVVADDLSFAAEMLAVVTAEAALRIVMADVVQVRFPIRFHLGEEVGLIDPLDLCNGGVYRLSLLRIQITVLVRLNIGCDGADRLVICRVRFCQRLDSFGFKERK